MNRDAVIAIGQIVGVLLVGVTLVSTPVGRTRSGSTKGRQP